MSSVYRSEAGRDIIRAWCTQRLDEWATPHTREELPTAAGRTHVVLAGSGSRAFIFLPGTNFNAATSLPFAAELAASNRLLLPDLPGQPGLSSSERLGRDRVSAYGAWASEVIGWARQDASIDYLVLVGHSLGAAAALAAPTEGVDALVLINPAGLCPVRVSPAVLATSVSWLIRRSRRSADRLVEKMTGPDHSASPLTAEWLALVSRHTHPVGAPGPLPMTKTDAWKATPHRILVSSHDCFLRPTELAAAVKQRFDGDVVILPNLGHLSVEEDPAQVAAAFARI